VRAVLLLVQIVLRRMTVPTPSAAPARRGAAGGRHRHRRRGGESGGRDQARTPAFISPRDELGAPLQFDDDDDDDDDDECVGNNFILGRLSLDESVASSPREAGRTRSEPSLVKCSTTLTEDASVEDAYSLALVTSASTNADAPPSPMPAIQESPSPSSKMYLKSIQYRLERKKSRSGQRPGEQQQQEGQARRMPPACGSEADGVGLTDAALQNAPPPTVIPSSPVSTSKKAPQQLQQRMQLERGYPLHRENAERKKKKTEQRFLRLSQKTEAYSKKNRSEGLIDTAVERRPAETHHPDTSSLAGSRMETPKAKENHAPPRTTKRTSTEDGIAATEGRAFGLPASPTMALPPRPLGSKGSPRAPRMPVLQTTFPLHRSRSSSPRRRSNSEKEDRSCQEAAPPAAQSMEPRATVPASASKMMRSRRARSESPSARTLPPPPIETFAAMMNPPPPPPDARQHRPDNGRTSQFAGDPRQKVAARDAYGAAFTQEVMATARSNHAPPRSPSVRSERVEKHRRFEDWDSHRNDAKAIHRTGSVTCLSSPSSVASTVLNFGTVALTQCIAPTLMNDDHYRMHPRADGRSRSGERKPTAAAPAPFFLPGMASSAPRSPASPVQSPSSSLALKRASNTRDELIKLKNELATKRRETLMPEQKPQTTGKPAPAELRAVDGGRGDTYQARKQHELRVLHGSRACEKRVRFSSPLITAIRHRPKTKAEDIDKLYFGEDELEELEADRATVDGDQFEMALVDLPRSAPARDNHGDDVDPGRCERARSAIPIAECDAATVAVTYTNKRVHRLEEGGDEVPFSPSDDTSFTYYEK
jgi:hypothetical protein